ncbi:folate family ECF transporter S component [Lachnospiraceae bacterium MD308]|jgi:ECF transporter S component (folate family)|nr:folate family ECF transporter S component [Lachnospiraceae bacterium MD308]MCI8579215.1 folate family ECF transporter S component [Dorea sp.]
MKGIKALFADSIQELKDLRTLAVTAMLLAIAVVLGFYTLQLTDYIKIGFAYIANETTGMLFGPAVGGIMGGLADLLKYLVKPTGPFFPGFTISGICGGIIYGIVLYKKPLTVKRVVFANFLVMVLVNILLNTYWLTLLYGDAYLALLPVRILKQAVMLPIETALFYTVAKVLTKANVFAMMRGTKAA